MIMSHEMLEDTSVESQVGETPVDQLPVQETAPNGTSESDPELESLKTRVGEFLTKAKDTLKYLEGFNAAEQKQKEISQGLGNEAPPHLMESYVRHKTNKAVLKGMIEDIQYAQESLTQGRKVIGGMYPISDILQKHIDRWNKEFETP